MERKTGKKLENPKRLRKKMIKYFGAKTTSTYKILEHFCPKMSIHYSELEGRKECREALKKKRLIVATIHLYAKEWANLKKFYQKHPKGVLKRDKLKTDDHKDEREGHSVVIIGFVDGYWIMRNSWGVNFADKGYFRVAKNAFKFISFYDVFYTKEEDIINY